MKNSNLFAPITLGRYALKNRIVLPPLTRQRSAQPGDVPTPLMAAYYRQRAGAGFMVAALVTACLAATAMALQNVLLHLTRRPAPTTAMMTGNLVVCTLALAAIAFGPEDARPAAKVRWASSWPLLAGFCTGCGLGAVCVRLAADEAWAGAALLSALLLAAQMRTPRVAAPTDAICWLCSRLVLRSELGRPHAEAPPEGRAERSRRRVPAGARHLRDRQVR